LASKTGQKNPVGAAYTCASKISRISYLLKIGMEALQKNSPLVDPDFGRAVPAPDFSPGERVFKPARTHYLAMTGLLALVRTPPQTAKSRLFPRPLSRALQAAQLLVFCIRARL
jgi:hypothetical protein